MVEHHRNQGYTRSKPHFTDRFGPSVSRGFRNINCRSFELCNRSLPISPPSFHCFDRSPKLKRPVSRSEPSKSSRRSNPISISPKPPPKLTSFCEELSFSELWAGPTYSYSPSPSSLPLPKFSLRPKRSISLDLSGTRPEISFPHDTKSPADTQVRDVSMPSPDLFRNTASATENLRRILNLDLID